MFQLMVSALLAISPAQPPSSGQDVHLSIRGRTVGVLANAVQGVNCVRCRLVRPMGFSQQGGADSYTPPPLVPSDPNEQISPPPPPPGGEIPDYNNVPPEQKRPPLPRELPRTDPHAGDWVGSEALVGGLTLFATDLVAGVLLLGVALATVGGGLSNNSGSALAAGLVIFFGGLFLHAILSPLYCALAEKAFADEPTNSGLAGAMVGAYASAFALGAVFIVLELAVSSIFGNGANVNGSAYSTFTSLLTLFGLVGRYVGVPIATSYGMHFGTASSHNEYSEAQDPRPYRWITRVSKFGVEELPISAPTAFAF